MTDPEEWRENRAKWAAALRDPKRRQTTGKLGHQDKDGQCCLGVLAEIAGCEFSLAGSYCDWDSHINNAPPRAMDFVGLQYQNGEYARSSLSNDNDGGKSFAEIADIIESEPEGLFR